MNSAHEQNQSDDDSRIDEEPSSSSGSRSCGKDESQNKKSNKQTNYPVPSCSSSSSSATSSVRPQAANRTGPGWTSDEQATKRDSVKKLIERYFYQLMQGCGNTKCCNKNCASSGKVGRLTPNAAAARAIQLYSQEADLCYETQPTNAAKTDNENNAACSSAFPFHSPSAQGTNESHSSPGQQSNAHRQEKSKESKADKEMDAAYDNSAFDIDSIEEEDSRTKPSETMDPRNGVTSPSTTVRHQPESLSAEGEKPAPSVRSSCCSSSSEYYPDTGDEVPYLDERKLKELTERSVLENSQASLIHTLKTVFSSPRGLAASFQFCPASSSIERMLARAPAGDLRNIKKEDLRSLEGDLDKDEDSKAPTKAVPDVPDPAHTTVDVESLRRALKALHAARPDVFGPINEALRLLGVIILHELDAGGLTSHEEKESLVTVFVIAFETLLVGSADCLEGSFPRICEAVVRLPVWAQCRLVRIWAEHCKESIHPLVILLQQLLTVRTLMMTYDSNFESMRVNDNETICNATMVLKLVYYANILAGELEPKHYRELNVRDKSLPAYTYLSLIPEEDDVPAIETDVQSRQRKPEDPLAAELDVNPLDCRKPLVPYEEFYNENLCDAMEVEFDYMAYKHLLQHRASAYNGAGSWRAGLEGPKFFSFIHYPFVMTPTAKTLALYFDSRIRMFSERRLSFLEQQRQLNQLHTTSELQTANPYLNLKIRRDHIIEDALVELEIIAMSNPKDLKKQLVVEFTGEQGIDEGGVSKEFFQLIIEEIFNPDFGMFMTNEDSNTVWFNPVSFENEAQFTLIGIVLGLAIYNNIILAVNFPMVVYRKLMGMKGSFLDLKDQNPVLYNSLKSLLEYTEDDMKEVFMQTFKIAYRDVFGTVLEYELKPDGDNIFVTQDNKHEFVELYSDFMLNKSIEKQFSAFSSGFQMVTSESLLHLLFRPEELELIVCGSKKFDFHELEIATEYQGGFERNSKTITDFWSIVHGLSMEMKRKLIQFTTGSDRVPVGGLSRLKLIIARNGPDSDRLPTSHTCFNVLLLPEYSSKEKLEERLLKAINYSKGFGML